MSAPAAESEPTSQMEQIAARTYLSTDYPGSTVGFYVMPTGVVAIDAPVFPRDVRAWRERIGETAGGPIIYLILTDAHPARLLSASRMGAPIVASRQAFEQASTYTDGYWRAVAERWARRCPEAAEDLAVSHVVLPEIVFTDRVTLHSGDEALTLQKACGAAPGSLWLHLPDQNVLFTGDTVVVGVHPSVASVTSTRAWLQTLTLLRRPRFAQTLIAPGRGPASDTSATQPLSDYIALVRRRVRSLLRASRPRSDTPTLVSELMSCFPVPEGERDSTARRVKATVDRVYDELREQ